MSVQKLPGGTRGTRPPPRLINKIMMPLMTRVHRRSGDRFAGMDLLYLTTVGARSGEQRTNPVARFDDGQGGWVVVASAGGTAHHPGWYHNIVAHPDQVWAEVRGTKRQVTVEQLEGEVRDRVWALVTQHAPRFESYLAKTDRQLPVLRLTPHGEPGTAGP
jgi:deazaflavin-dependent oxidoreductase (nitroreductase family)